MNNDIILAMKSKMLGGEVSIWKLENGSSFLCTSALQGLNSVMCPFVRKITNEAAMKSNAYHDFVPHISDIFCRD